MGTDSLSSWGLSVLSSSTRHSAKYIYDDVPAYCSLIVSVHFWELPCAGNIFASADHNVGYAGRARPSGCCTRPFNARNGLKLIEALRRSVPRRNELSNTAARLCSAAVPWHWCEQNFFSTVGSSGTSSQEATGNAVHSL